MLLFNVRTIAEGAEKRVNSQTTVHFYSTHSLSRWLCEKTETKTNKNRIPSAFGITKTLGIRIKYYIIGILDQSPLNIVHALLPCLVWYFTHRLHLIRALFFFVNRENIFFSSKFQIRFFSIEFWHVFYAISIISWNFRSHEMIEIEFSKCIRSQTNKMNFFLIHRMT